MKAALKASGAPTDADVKSNWDTGGFQDSLPARLPGARGAFVLTVRRILLICGATAEAALFLYITNPRINSRKQH